MTVDFFKKLNIFLCLVLVVLLVLVYQNRAPNQLGLDSAPKVGQAKTY